MNLNETHKKWLLDHARRIIAEGLQGKGPEPDQRIVPAELQMNCGVFVSLYVDGKLRGCIGTFSEDRSLEENLYRMALAAAMEDHRFKPVLPEEVEDMQIEISVLTPRQRVADHRQIIPGRHGIYMKKGYRTGTLLPQVAVKQDWDLESFSGIVQGKRQGSAGMAGGMLNSIPMKHTYLNPEGDEKRTSYHSIDGTTHSRSSASDHFILYLSKVWRLPGLSCQHHGYASMG